jgi:PAS domain S-box-containing protein
MKDGRASEDERRCGNWTHRLQLRLRYASGGGSPPAVGARGAEEHPQASSSPSFIHRERLTGVQAARRETALIAHAPDAIIFADGVGVIHVWNQGAEALFGYSAAEAIGHTLALIVPEPSRPAHWAGFSRAVQQGRFTKEAVLQTSRALTKDGRTIVVALAAAILWSPSGHVQGIMAIGRDVTERRTREQAQRAYIAR